MLPDTVESFAVLGATPKVSNTGRSVISGNLGVSPACEVTGESDIVITGTIHKCDAVAAQAQRELTTAYNDLAGRTPTEVPTELGGLERGAASSFSATRRMRRPPVSARVPPRRSKMPSS